MSGGGKPGRTRRLASRRTRIHPSSKCICESKLGPKTAKNKGRLVLGGIAPRHARLVRVIKVSMPACRNYSDCCAAKFRMRTYERPDKFVAVPTGISYQRSHASGGPELESVGPTRPRARTRWASADPGKQVGPAPFPVAAGARWHAHCQKRTRDRSPSCQTLVCDRIDVAERGRTNMVKAVV